MLRRTVGTPATSVRAARHYSCATWLTTCGRRARAGRGAGRHPGPARRRPRRRSAATASSRRCTCAAGRPWLLDAHLDRMAALGGAAGAGAADRGRRWPTWLDDGAARAWPAGVEGALRLVCTRGPEGGRAAARSSRPLGRSATGSARPAATGVTVATASLGVAGGRPERRAVAARRRQDAVVRGEHGRPAVGGGAGRRRRAVGLQPTATRWRRRRRRWSGSTTASLCTVPAGATGILPGTTAALPVDHAGELGWAAEERLVTPGRAARGRRRLADLVRPRTGRGTRAGRRHKVAVVVGEPPARRSVVSSSG